MNYKLSKQDNAVFDYSGYSSADLSAACAATGFKVQGFSTSGANKVNVDTLEAWMRENIGLRRSLVLKELVNMKRNPIKPNPLNIEPIIKGSQAFEIGDKVMTVTKGTDVFSVSTENGYAKCNEGPEMAKFKTEICRATLALDLAAFSEVIQGKVHEKVGETVNFAVQYPQIAVANRVKDMVEAINQNDPLPSVSKGLAHASAMYDRLMKLPLVEILRPMEEINRLDGDQLKAHYKYGKIKVGAAEYEAIKTKREMPIPPNNWFDINESELSEATVRQTALLSFKAVGSDDNGMGQIAKQFIDGIPLSNDSRRYVNAWRSISHIDFNVERKFAFKMTNATLVAFLWKQAFEVSGGHGNKTPLVFYFESKTPGPDYTDQETNGGIIPIKGVASQGNAVLVDIDCSDNQLQDFTKARIEADNWIKAQGPTWSFHKRICVMAPLLTARKLLSVADEDGNYKFKAYRCPATCFGYYMVSSCAIKVKELGLAELFRHVKIMSWLRHRYYYFRMTYETFCVKQKGNREVVPFGKFKYLTLVKDDLMNVEIDSDSSMCDDDVSVSLIQAIEMGLEQAIRGDIIIPKAQGAPVVKVAEEKMEGDEINLDNIAVDF